jgi:DNA-binding MarR family transcriptional regulator
MSAIAQALSYSKQSLTVIVDQLEKDGLVERLPDPTDRRVSKIALTDKGKSLMARRKEALKNRISVDLSHLSQKDLEHLAMGLEEIRAVLPKIQQV